MALDKSKKKQIDNLVTEASDYSESVQTESKKADNITRKQSDYIKLLLRPRNGKDYKSYVEKRAIEETGKLGMKVTATSYIQNLIDLDMQKNSGRISKREKVIDQLTKLSDKQLDGLFALLSEM
ncbi:MAG: hypothetical protein E7244_27735 [Enterocloster citroniae]|nr:hypothetical protein [Enterocloster citroniae]